MLDFEDAEVSLDGAGIARKRSRSYKGIRARVQGTPNSERNGVHRERGEKLTNSSRSYSKVVVRAGALVSRTAIMTTALEKQVIITKRTQSTGNETSCYGRNVVLNYCRISISRWKRRVDDCFFY